MYVLRRKDISIEFVIVRVMHRDFFCLSIHAQYSPKKLDPLH